MIKRRFFKSQGTKSQGLGFGALGFLTKYLLPASLILPEIQGKIIIYAQNNLNLLQPP